VQEDVTLSSENKNLAFDMLAHFRTWRTGSAPTAILWIGLMFMLSAVILFCAHVTPACPAAILTAGVVFIAIWAICFYLNYGNEMRLRDREMQGMQMGGYAVLDP
jgi:hypothetical protein